MKNYYYFERNYYHVYRVQLRDAQTGEFNYNEFVCAHDSGDAAAIAERDNPGELWGHVEEVKMPIELARVAELLNAHGNGMTRSEIQAIISILIQTLPDVVDREEVEE